MNDTPERITPIFIFSLPRSGSTLTQRILATHPEVGTASETWLLLPLLYTMRCHGTYTEYAHRIAYKAIEDFCAELPGGPDEYLDAIKGLALRLYARRAQPGSRYFVDKTPRYHVISAEIIRIFPDAQFVFLWRNPLAVVGSIIETWGRGRWNVYEFDFDLYDGLEHLVAACRESGTRASTIRYEDLVAERGDTRQRLFRELGLAFDESRADQFADVRLGGRMGDQIGSESYTALSREPLEKWKSVLASPLRKMWCRRYLHWIGDERLRIMGYDLSALLHDLDSIPIRLHTTLSDLVRMMFGLAVRTCEPWIVRDKLLRLRRGQRLRAHS